MCSAMLQTTRHVDGTNAITNSMRRHCVGSLEFGLRSYNLDVIMYYLRKKYKNKNFPRKRYTTTDYFFKVYIDKTYVNYYDAGKDLDTQDAYAKTNEVADMEIKLINTIKGFSPCAVVYAEYLSEELDIPSSRIDAHYHHLRYASLLCKYGFIKAENRYVSENDDPPRPRMKFTPKESDRVLRIQ
ncbi:hypothetical protein FXO38_17562 [Capsicum annuum]|nr:hypothetical protein FXO38_17562 [Capsicum annuum]